MKTIENFLIGLVALLHVGFLVLEMFLWQTEIGLKVFHTTSEMASQTAVLAKNQGLYNGFLAAGLFWTYFLKDDDFKKSSRTFFLTCIVIAGVFGALTASGTILFVQALPALLALAAVRRS